jgi:hypothetical protein
MSVHAKRHIDDKAPEGIVSTCMPRASKPHQPIPDLRKPSVSPKQAQRNRENEKKRREELQREFERECPEIVAEKRAVARELEAQREASQRLGRNLPFLQQRGCIIPSRRDDKIYDICKADDHIAHWCPRNTKPCRHGGPEEFPKPPHIIFWAADSIYKTDERRDFLNIPTLTSRRFRPMARSITAPGNDKLLPINGPGVCVYRLSFMA